MRGLKKLVVNQGAHNPDIAPADQFGAHLESKA
jgi:hypothetical protein